MRERGVTEEGGAVDRGAMGRVGEGGGMHRGLHHL